MLNGKENSYEILGSGVSLLQIAFIVLKLCKVINWSWWWVLAPMWIDIAIAIVTICILAIIKKREDKAWREMMKRQEGK